MLIPFLLINLLGQVFAYERDENQFYFLPGQNLAEGSWRSSLGVDYFSSSSRFNSDGEEVPFNEGESYQKIDGELGGLFALTSSWSLGVGIRGRQHTSENAAESISTQALESGRLDVRYALIHFKSPWNVAFKGSVRQTFYHNENYARANLVPTDDLVAGDSGTDLYAGIEAGRFSKGREYAFGFEAGLRQPGNKLSLEVPYDVHVAFIKGTAWSFVGKLGVEGIFSLKQDEVGSREFQATGVTALYNSTNRQYAAPYVSLAIGKGQWALEGRARLQTMAQSSDSGVGVSANIIYLGQSHVSEGQVRVREQVFKEYHGEARIVKVSQNPFFFKIDQGTLHGFKKGLQADVYHTDQNGAQVLVATSTVFDAGIDWAILKVKQFYRQKRCAEGMAVRLFGEN
jgi:hypothetical protein